VLEEFCVIFAMKKQIDTAKIVDVPFAPPIVQSADFAVSIYA
jgi:hypothetical protein